MSMKSTAICDFLLKIFRNLSSLLYNQVYYTIKFIIQSSLLYNLIYLSLLDSFLFLRRFSAFLKSLDNYFLRWFAYKSLLSRFSVLISYNMWSSNHFSIPSRFPCFSRLRFFRFQVFQGPGFSESRFSGSRFSGSRVQIPGPGFRSSPFQNDK